MVSVFVISKPLQYFNATNIPDDNSKVCLLVNGFYKASTIYSEIKEKSSYWDECFFFEDWKESFKWIIKNKEKIKNVYIDSDYGFKKQFYLRKISPLSIFVYEEGIGNYRKYVRPNKKVNKLLEFVYSILKVDDYIGGYIFTKGIFLYDIERFKQAFPKYGKKLYEFKNSFKHHLTEFEDKDIFCDKTALNFIRSSPNKKIVIYLTSWRYEDKINNLLLEYESYVKILKPHPHINISKEHIHLYDYILSGETLIELFMNEVLDYVDEMIILHHNSSALLYFKNEKKIISIIV